MDETTQTRSANVARRPQFSLKGLFGITAVLSALLAMFVSDSFVLVGAGWSSLMLIVGGFVGYIINGRKGAEVGVFVVVCVCAVVTMAVFLAYVILGLFALQDSLPL